MGDYKHTIRLISGEEITVYSQERDLISSSVKFGDSVSVFSVGDSVMYTIPVMNILYIETIEVDE